MDLELPNPQQTARLMVQQLAWSAIDSEEPEIRIGAGRARADQWPIQVELTVVSPLLRKEKRAAWQLSAQGMEGLSAVEVANSLALEITANLREMAHTGTLEQLSSDAG